MNGISRMVIRVLDRRLSVAAAVVGLGALAACSDSTAVGRNGPSQLGFTTSSSTAAGAALADFVPITKGGHTLDLTQVTIVVDHAHLKRVNTNACAGDEDEHDAKWGGHSEPCASVRVGPTLVDLPLDAGMVSLPMDVIPAGTYREIELRISLARLVGTFDGKAFDVTIPVETKTEIEFATSLVVTDGTPTSITINVPIGEWLTNADGSLVDPRLLTTNQALLAGVRARIAASLHAFEDEDHNGKEDHNRVEHGD